MRESLVSVIVPTCNHSEYLHAFFDSLVNESKECGHIQVVFVDDGSTDNTPEIIASLPEIPGKIEVEYLRIAHSGQAEAVSCGLPLVKGEFIMLCDDDDLLVSGAISGKVAALKQHPECDFVISNSEWFNDADGGLLRLGYDNIPDGTPVLLSCFLEDTIPCLAGTYMLRTSFFDIIYPQRRIPFCEEGQNLQFLIPAAAKGSGMFLSGVHLRYRIHSGSHSHRMLTLKDALKRNESLRDLKIGLLEHCGCLNDENLKIVNDRHNNRKSAILHEAVSQMHK